MWVSNVSRRSCLSALLLLALVILTARCGGTTSTSIVGPAASKCDVAVTNNTPEIPASGGSGTLALTAARECSWTASADASWISLATTAGQGAATVNYSVLPNPNGTSRRGRVVVAEQPVDVVQAAAPCRYEVVPSAINVGAARGEVTVRLDAPDGCRWTARGDTSWIGTPAPAEGSGSATVRIAIQANPAQPRSGSVTIGNATVRINQSGTTDGAPAPPAPEPAPNPPGPGPTPSCSYSVSPTQFALGATGELVTIDVTAQGGCPWTASTGTPWIVLPPGAAGSGSGSIRAEVRGNTGSARTGTITVADHTVTIEQAAPAAPSCSYRLAESRRSVGRQSDTFAVGVNAPPGCAWTVSSDVRWIAIADGRTGTGNGSFRLAVEANGGAARTGTVRVATETFTVEQAGGTCTYSIKPDHYNAGRGPDDILIDVTADDGCTWTASTNANWVTVQSGRTGSGNGTVRLTIPANGGSARNTVVTIAGHAFALTQEGTCNFSIKPRSWHSGRGPDDIRVDVTTDPGCTWTATSNATWVSVAEGRTGTGGAAVRLLVQPNSGPARSTTLTIAGQPFELRQDAGQ
jgi:hypothetical protein